MPAVLLGFLSARFAGGRRLAGADSTAKVTVTEAIQVAERNNPLIGAAMADLSGARAGARAAKADTLPKLSANGFAATGNEQSIMGSSPTVEPPMWMLAQSGGFLDGNLALMAPILAPRSYALAGAAAWQAKAATGDLAEARAELALQVTEAFDRVLAARQFEAAEQAAVDASQELVRTTTALADAGKGIQASVERAKAELSHARQTIAATKNEEAKALVDLSAAMNVDMSSPPDPIGNLFGVQPPQKLDKYLSLAHENRGSLAAARARVAGAELEIRAANGRRSPELYGGVMADVVNHQDMGGLSAGLTLSIPLYDGGRAGAELAQAQAMRTKARALLKQAELEVERDVRNAWFDLQTAQQNVAAAADSVQAAQTAYEVTALRVSAGKSILIEQLDALGALGRARADLAQAAFDQAIALAKLNRAAGGRP